MTTIRHLCDAYLSHATTYYSNTPAILRHLAALRDLLWLTVDSELPAAEFGPKRLKAVREVMITGGWARASGRVTKPWSRSYANAQTERLKQMFRWGVGEELVPHAVYAALTCVDGLRAGKTTAREAKGKVHSVSQEHVDAVVPFMSDRMGSVLRLIMLTGMRPGEAVRLCPRDLNQREQDWWIWEPDQHKTAGKNKTRIVSFCPKAIAILKHNMPLGTELPFFPFTVDAIWRAVNAACKRAGIPHFWPYMARHFSATMVRDMMGSEAASVHLGHAHLNTSDIYGEKSLRILRSVAQRIG